MDEFDDNEIARLLRLKRYEQPPPGYFENFLHEFHRRQRDEMVRQPLWRICLERAHGLRRSNFIKDLSATADGSRRSPEPAGFVRADKRGRGMEPYISGGHADFQDAAGSPFQ